MKFNIASSIEAGISILVFLSFTLFIFILLGVNIYLWSGLLHIWC
jgi:hypothetical protein